MQQRTTMTPTDDRSDTDLLLAYGRDGDEAAFEALAGRHVDMIFAVSLRRSGNRQLAEEATQNVLVSLSIKARKLSARASSLSGWLHASTRFEVSKLQRREARIKTREQAYASNHMKTSSQSEDEAFERLFPMLDQAIDHLRAADREVIVRRYLEGQNFRRIGEALGISEDAAQKRANRALDRLNLFFKRKAGVTVSAAALAAGVSQHCAEAAPAACLDIAGKAASTGLASILTTTTTTIATTGIGKITAVVAGIIVLGGAVAFLASHNGTPPETVSTPTPTNSAPGAPSASQSTVETVAAGTGGADPAAESAKPYSANEELAKLEAMSPHPSQDEMARRLSVKHEQLLKDLTAEIGLSDVQVAALRSVLDTRLNAFRASLDPNARPGVSPENVEKEMITKAGSIIRGAGLREDLAGTLSDKQLTAFDEREEKIWQSQVESYAYRELSKLTPVLKLSDKQKDQVFDRLQTSSAEKLKADGDVRAFMALMQNQAPTKMELADLAEADVLSAAMDGPNALSPDSPDFKKQITEVVGGRIRKQVELLAPVLDQAQKERYHDHLVSKSVLPMFGIKLPAPSQK
jgi:RNA polymerase sigma factor (sigma-70 family)